MALKIIFPILEGCSLEDEDDNLATKWAALLASAAAGDPVHTSYPKILAELTPAEARLLDAMYQRLMDSGSNEEQALLTTQELSEKMQLHTEQFVLAISNLARHRLCDFPVYTAGDPLLYVNHVQKIANNIKIKLTLLGQDFVRACSGPRSLLR